METAETLQEGILLLAMLESIIPDHSAAPWLQEEASRNAHGEQEKLGVQTNAALKYISGSGAHREVTMGP